MGITKFLNSERLTVLIRVLFKKKNSREYIHGHKLLKRNPSWGQEKHKLWGVAHTTAALSVAESKI